MIPKCRKCGKDLRNPVSRRLGIGPVCLKKEQGLSLRQALILHEGIRYPELLKEEEHANKSGD